MKKTVFTICSVLTVCAVIIMSCEKKDDPNMHKVYYNTQTGYSTGGNPNPNGVSTSGGVSTTSGTTSSGTSTTGTSTTGSSCTNAMTVNSVACTSVSAAGGVVSGTYRLIHSGSCIQVQLTFPGGAAPASGTYQIVASGPTGNQCTFLDNTNSINATGGTVTVTAGSPNKATYSGVSVGALTASGTACY